MTYHIKSPEYTCKTCSATFIAYKKFLECPVCKDVELSNGESYNFIDELINSMIVHRRQFGRYRPSAWFIGNLSDDIQMSVYRLFDQLRFNNKVGFDELVTSIRKIESEDPSFTNYLLSIVEDVYKRRSEFENINYTKLDKIKSVIKSLFTS